MPSFDAVSAEWWRWGLAGGLAVVALLAGLFGVLIPRLARKAPISWSCKGLLLLLSAVAILDLLQLDSVQLVEPFQSLSRIALLGLGILGFVAVLRWSTSATQEKSRLSMVRLPLALLLVGGGLTAWMGFRFIAEGETDAFNLDEFAKTQELAKPVQARSVTAFTDKGTPIKVFTNGDLAEVSVADENRYLDEARFSNRVIQTAPPADRYNCHGWTFSDGQYFLTADAVEVILCDNDYQVVEHPAAGDVIVYRDGEGVVIHTGIVRAVGTNGLVLIESKWGLRGRYLHEPHVQCYSDNYSYYHSARSGHLLSGLPKRGHDESSAEQVGEDITE